MKSVKQRSTTAHYDKTTFYQAWRLIIQRYGIYIPYTGRGAVKGLRPQEVWGILGYARPPGAYAAWQVVTA